MQRALNGLLDRHGAEVGVRIDLSGLAGGILNGRAMRDSGLEPSFGERCMSPQDLETHAQGIEGICDLAWLPATAYAVRRTSQSLKFRFTHAEGLVAHRLESVWLSRRLRWNKGCTKERRLSRAVFQRHIVYRLP